MAMQRKDDVTKSTGNKPAMSAAKGGAARLAKTTEADAERHLGHLDSERLSRLRKRQTKF